MLGAVTEREANLTTALVVFVILSVLLTVFVVMMFANKKFRAFFFRTDANDDKPKKEKRAKPSKAKKPDSASPTPRREVAPRGRKKREQAASAQYLDEVPTVPLGGFSSAADDTDVMRRTSDAYINMAVSSVKRSPSKNQAKASDTLDKIPTVVIPQTTPQAAAPKRSASSTEPAKGGKANAKAQANAAKTEKAATAKKPSKK